MKRRSRWLLFLVVLTVVAAGTWAGLWARERYGGAAGEEQAAPSAPVERRVPVLTAPCATREFVRGVRVAGNVEAARQALVSARVPGTLDEVLVDEGDRVVAGETVLFRTDSANLARAVELARHEGEVARSGLDEAEANRRRLLATLEQAEVDRDRYRRLAAKNAATTHELEQKETALREAQANVEHAEAVIALATARQSQAAAQLQIAEKDLADSAVKAPIDGRVTARLREPGEMAGAGTPVLRIEDTGSLDLVAFVPEQHYADVVPGETEVRVRLAGVELPPQTVSFRGPVVDTAHRNFEVEVRIDDPPPGLVPGRLVEMTIVLEARQALGVPREAIVRRGGDSVVFTIDERDRARAVPVTPGLLTDGHVEVITEALTPGQQIVVEGQDWLDPGALVQRLEGS